MAFPLSQSSQAIFLGIVAFAGTCFGQSPETLPLPVIIKDLTNPPSPSDRMVVHVAKVLQDEELAEDEDLGDDDDLLGDDDEGTGDDELDSLLDEDLTSIRSTSVAAPSLDVEVSSVSRQTSTIGRSPTAIFVISQEMIRRSGARTIPDALRLAPGLHVAHIDGNKWSISSRGYGNRFSNKLLVQIDGRSVYTPLFAGVFWDIQDMLLDNVERIEVIRGPGATIWGANAVNGIINIITKKASETHGVYKIVGTGTEHQAFTGARVGGRTDKGVDWRITGKWFDRDEFHLPGGVANDGMDLGRLSFRSDWNRNHYDSFTLQGDYYDGSAGSSFNRPLIGAFTDTGQFSGGYALGRWTRTHSKTSESSMQVYYDRTHRNSAGFDQHINVFDVDFFHRCQRNCRNSTIWGLGYRRIWDDLTNGIPPFSITTIPEQQTVEIFSAFLQNEYMLQKDVSYFTIGTKISHNTYSGLEIQPSARLLYLPNEKTATWASVSRAVRTPSRVSQTIRVIVSPLPSPPFPAGTTTNLLGSVDADSESLIAYECGIRQQTRECFSWDLSLFYNVHDDIHGTRQLAMPGIPPVPFLTFFNAAQSDSYGLELSSTLDMTESWRLRSWYSFITVDLDTSPLSLQSPISVERSTPRHQAFLMSSWTLPRNWEFDVISRYHDSVLAVEVPSYISMDVRASWRPTRTLQLTVVGQNLLDSYHAEYGTNRFTGDVATEVPRGVYGSIECRY